MTSGVPVPMELPPQELSNHRSVVPEPPLAVSVMLPESFGQKLFRSTIAETGATGGGVTVTVTCAQSLKQPASVLVRTKNVVVVFTGPELTGEPVAKGASCPPQLPVNHCNVLPAGVFAPKDAESEDDEPGQTGLGEA